MKNQEKPSGSEPWPEGEAAAKARTHKRARRILISSAVLIAVSLLLFWMSLPNPSIVILFVGSVSALLSTAIYIRTYDYSRDLNLTKQERKEATH